MHFLSVAFLGALFTVSPLLAFPPDVGYQPAAPLQITRCAVKVSIDRKNNTKTIRYFQQMFLKNVSHRGIGSADFSVLGADSDGPIISQNVTTKWERPMRPDATTVAVFRGSASLDRYSQSTPWDLVETFRCAVLRVHFLDHRTWKDLPVIQLAADASPEGCTVDLPDGGATATSCEQDSRMTTKDKATYDNLEAPTSLAYVRRAPPRATAPRATLPRATPKANALALLPKQPCSRDAAIVGKAAEPDYPDVAREQGAVGTALVEVSLDETGAVTNATVTKSTNNAALDKAAVNAAKATTYEPAIVACKPVGGSYLYQAEFTEPTPSPEPHP